MNCFTKNPNLKKNLLTGVSDFFTMNPNFNNFFWGGGGGAGGG